LTDIDPQTSFNFAVAKVISILLVAAGHFFEKSLLWIPVDVGLFVFAYSSASFTAKIYKPGFSIKSFWNNKLGRLAIPFWITQGFLLLLFQVFGMGREGVWTWQTAVHWTGQSGWLNWLGLPNPSPFGNGLWFITVLLLFYIVYPWLARLNEVKPRASLYLALGLVSAVAMDHLFKVGYALWNTSFAFWFGVYAARHPIGGSARIWLAIGMVCTLAMLGLNFAGIKLFNNYLIVSAAIAMVLWLERARLHRRLLAWLLWLSPCVLEIYLIHTYLFVDWGLALPFRFVVSMILTIACAQMLAHLIDWVKRRSLRLVI
jgi:hypothetical protein